MDNNIKNQKPLKPLKSSVTIENREKGVLNGVEKVISSSESSLILSTEHGGLTILGDGLKITKYDMDSKTLSFDGVVNSLKYSGKKENILKKMFS